MTITRVVWLLLGQSVSRAAIRPSCRRPRSRLSSWGHDDQCDHDEQQRQRDRLDEALRVTSQSEVGVDAGRDGAETSRRADQLRYRKCAHAEYEDQHSCGRDRRCQQGQRDGSGALSPDLPPRSSRCAFGGRLGAGRKANCDDQINQGHDIDGDDHRDADRALDLHPGEAEQFARQAGSRVRSQPAVPKDEIGHQERQQHRRPPKRAARQLRVSER